MHTIDLTAHAPAGALCADCWCSCAGETVVVERQPGPLGGTLTTYRHLHGDDCRAAQARSAAYWTGADATQRARAGRDVGEVGA